MEHPELLGVALVVDDLHKGCHLAFRYPPPPSPSSKSKFHRLSAALTAKLLRPKNALCNQSFELAIDSLHFVSHPVVVSHRPTAYATVVRNGAYSSSPSSRPVHGSTSDDTGKETTMFNVIFALAEPPEWSSTCYTAYRTVAAQISNALLHEELRSGFVSHEVRQLLQLREDHKDESRRECSVNVADRSSGDSNNTSRTERKEGESNKSLVEVDPRTFTDWALQSSTLANDLKRIFHGLRDTGVVHVVMNRWVKLSLTLTQAVGPAIHDLRPYHTLLLLQEEEKILAQLPPDHSQQLRVLIEATNPLKSFQELALETSLPIHQLFQLAAHLVFWGFGRIVDTITMHNIYQVHPKAQIGPSSSGIAVAFRIKFPMRELGETLAVFSQAKRLGEHIKPLSTNAKEEYIHVLIWLLQNELIFQLHRYVYFMIPSENDDASEEETNQRPSMPFLSTSMRKRGHSWSTSSGLSPSLLPMDEEDVEISSSLSSQQASLVQPKGLPALAFSTSERAYLEKIATNTPVFALFKRLCVYFHGQHHMEEIMWRENISRSELRTVLSTYKESIVCCMHE